MRDTKTLGTARFEKYGRFPSFYCSNNIIGPMNDGTTTVTPYFSNFVPRILKGPEIGI